MSLTDRLIDLRKSAQALHVGVDPMNHLLQSHLWWCDAKLVPDFLDNAYTNCGIKSNHITDMYPFAKLVLLVYGRNLSLSTIADYSNIIEAFDSTECSVPTITKPQVQSTSTIFILKPSKGDGVYVSTSDTKTVSEAMAVDFIHISSMDVQNAQSVLSDVDDILSSYKMYPTLPVYKVNVDTITKLVGRLGGIAKAVVNTSTHDESNLPARRFEFSKYGIKIGTQIVSKDDKYVCTVSNDDTVMFNGERHTLSTLNKKLYNVASSTKFWKFRGVTLRQYVDLK